MVLDHAESIPNISSPTCDTIPKKTFGFVSTLRRTETINASHLCIHDFAPKVKYPLKYDIGGTYALENPEFWFMFTSTTYSRQHALLNLFVIHRKPGKFSINISKCTEYTQKEFKDEDPLEIFYTLPNVFEIYPFVTTKPGQVHFIKTFEFPTNITCPPETTLVIPIKINMSPKGFLDNNCLREVKLQHNMCGLIRITDETDCIVKSATNKEFKVHQIILTAHSRVLRDMLRNKKDTSVIFLDISDDDMELLLEFLYTGSFKDMNHDCMKLLEIADKFQLRSLFLLVQYIVDAHITVNNAIDMAIIAKNYKLQTMQDKIFDFILKNPETLETESFKNLKDVELAKHLIQFMQMQRA